MMPTFGLNPSESITAKYPKNLSAIVPYICSRANSKENISLKSLLYFLLIVDTLKYSSKKLTEFRGILVTLAIENARHSKFK